MEDGRQMMGKPSVLFRKTVNVEQPDGSQEAVNAQLYTVLVMDVPNLRRQHERYAHAQAHMPRRMPSPCIAAARLLSPSCAAWPGLASASQRPGLAGHSAAKAMIREGWWRVA